MVDRGCLSFTDKMGYLDSRILARAPVEYIHDLPADFVPGKSDVICSRGSDSYNHAGNAKLRELIEENIEKYAKANSKIEKTVIVTGIVETIREAADVRGGFIRYNKTTKRWQSVSDKLAREKVGQGFRTALKNQSTKQQSEPPFSVPAIAKAHTESNSKSTSLSMLPRQVTPDTGDASQTIENIMRSYEAKTPANSSNTYGTPRLISNSLLDDEPPAVRIVAKASHTIRCVPYEGEPSKPSSADEHAENYKIDATYKYPLPAFKRHDSSDSSKQVHEIRSWLENILPPALERFMSIGGCGAPALESLPSMDSLPPQFSRMSSFGCMDSLPPQFSRMSSLGFEMPDMERSTSLTLVPWMLE